MNKLYTPRLLSLAAELANYPLLVSLPLKADARSRTCGSTIKIAFETEDDGAVARTGMLVSACAIGQGSSAILASGAKGRSTESFGGALAELEAWLSGEGDLPEWPGIDALEAARDHPGRHGALLLPWRAAVNALSTAPLSSTPAAR